MSKMNRDTEGWVPETSDKKIQQTSQDATYTFNTAGKFADKNIVFKVNVPGVVIPTPTSGTKTFYITIGNPQVTYTWTVDSNGNVWVE